MVDKERKHLTSSYCVLDREPWNTTENWRRAGSDRPLAINHWPYQDMRENGICKSLSNFSSLLGGRCVPPLSCAPIMLS